MNAPRANVEWSEQFRLAAKSWVAKEAAASMLEESKSSVLSQHMMKLADLPVSRAEMQVKASEEWRDFIASMVKAREEANFAKVRCEFIRMRFGEWQSREATKRAEMKL